MVDDDVGVRGLITNHIDSMLKRLKTVFAAGLAEDEGCVVDVLDVQSVRVGVGGRDLEIHEAVQNGLQLYRGFRHTLTPPPGSA